MGKKVSKETKLTFKNYQGMQDIERNRLVKDEFHRQELDISMKVIKQYIPKKGHILDAGGGPGRYTILLAKQGYDMTLIDLVPDHITLAKKMIKRYKVNKKIKHISEGSITDLSEFKDNSFDVVLCLGGPLSHIHPVSERQKTIKELVRVAKKGAYIFVSVMSRYGVLLAGPHGRPEELEDKKQLVKLIKTGDDYRWRGDGFCHFFTAEELENAFKKEKVIIQKKIGLEGLNTSSRLTKIFVTEHPKAWKTWKEIQAEILCNDPFVVDASAHMMIIVRKK